METSQSFTDYADYTVNGEDYSPCIFEDYGSDFLPVLYSLFFVLGFLGNMFVLWVKIFGERIRTMTDVSLINLAIADLLLVCSLPFLAHQARDQWLFGDAMCKVVLCAYLVGFYCGIFFVTLMSVDRYLAIVHVFSAGETRTRSIGMKLAAVIWIAGLLSSFPELLFLQVSKHNTNPNKTFCSPLPERNHTTPGDGRHFWAIFSVFKMNILGLMIPMAIMGFCYTRIISVLRLSLQLSQTPMKQNAICFVLVVAAAFFCCWTPYNVASFFKALELLDVYTKCPSSKAIRLTLQITEVIAYSHSCLKPLLYFCVGGWFRRSLLELMNSAPCKLCHMTNEPDNSQQTPCVDENVVELIALKPNECVNSTN